MKKISVLVLLLLFTNGLFANTALRTDKQLWLAYTQQGRISKNWGYWFDGNHRTKNEFSNNLFTHLFRFGATYIIKDKFRVTAGYVLNLQFPTLNQNFMRDEHRPWQMFQYTYTSGRFRATHAFRSEQRFMRKFSGETVTDGYFFRQRFRYSYSVTVLFNKKEFKQGSFGAVLTDEVFVNAYSEDKVKAFDQNRAFGGLCYNLSDEIQVQFGYLNVFLFTPKGKELVHAIRLGINHTVDWRKKK